MLKTRLTFILLGISLFALYQCNWESNKSHALYEFVPKNTHHLYIVNQLETTPVIKELDSIQIKKAIVLIDTLQLKAPLYFCTFKGNSNDYLIISPLTKASDSLIESLTQKKKNSITIGDENYFINSHQKVLRLSNQKKLLNPNNTPEDFIEKCKNLISTASSQSDFTKINLQNSLPQNKHSEFLSINPDNYSVSVNTTGSQTYYSGAVQRMDSLNPVWELKDVKTGEQNFDQTWPLQLVRGIGFSYQSFPEKLLSGSKDSIIENTLLKGSSQFFSFETKNYKICGISVFDAELTLSNLNYTKETLFRGITIWKNEEGLAFSSFKPFLKDLNKSHYFISYNNHLFFADNVNHLKAYWQDFQQQNTLSKHPLFKNQSDLLSNKGHVLIISDQPPFYFSNSSLNTNWDESTKPLWASQMTFKPDFLFFNGIQSKVQQIENKGISELFEYEFQNEIISTPQLFKNPKAPCFLLLQDNKNTVYGITNNGNLAWKRNIGNPILGKAHLIKDPFSNSYNLAFATLNRVYILNAKGENTSGFPLKFNDSITQPLSLFDYDGNKKYRILVVQKNELLMYDKFGNRVKGFNPKKETKPLITSPVHLRINNKDYIVYKTTDKVRILNRRGNERIKTSSKYNLTATIPFKNGNYISTTTTDGKQLNIASNGRVKELKIGKSYASSIFSNGKNRVGITDNILHINQKNKELNFGIYTSPEVYTIQNTDVVLTTDKQTQNVFAYDVKGNTLPYFPVFGMERPTALSGGNRSWFLAVASAKNAVIVYHIN